jgi:hypothetical protein
VLEVNLKLSTSKGTVQTGKAVYHLGETVTVYLNDSDLAGQPSATAEIHSTSEPSPEPLTLTAQGGAGGFEGSIALASGSPAPDGVLQVSPGDIVTVVYQDAFDGSGPATATAEATVDLRIIVYDEPLNADPGWTAQGQWAFGVPTGQAGDHGQPDPTSGFTGTSVYGYNLSGGYANDLAAPEYLTSTPIDCTGGYSTLLTFYRWLNVEQSSYDHASVQISNDGLTWNTSGKIRMSPSKRRPGHCRSWTCRGTRTTGLQYKFAGHGTDRQRMDLLGLEYRRRAGASDPRRNHPIHHR